MNSRTIPLLLIFSIVLSGCSQPKVEYLCKVERGNYVHEYYLISSLPNDEEEVMRLVKDFNIQDTQAVNVQRVYLKKHNNRWLDLFGDNIDYRSDKCGEFDIIDIICSVQRFQTPVVTDTIWYNFHFPIINSYY